MISRIAVLVGAFMMALAVPVHSEGPHSAQLGYDRVGAIESIDLAGRIVRIDGRVYILPTDLAADSDVLYRVGDRIGYSVVPVSSSSGPRELGMILLVTH